MEEQLRLAMSPSAVQVLVGGRSLDSSAIPPEVDALESAVYVLKLRTTMYPQLNGEPDLRIWYHDIRLGYLAMEAAGQQGEERSLMFKHLMALVETCAPEIFALEFTDLAEAYLDVAHLALAAPRLREIRIDFCNLPAGFFWILCSQFQGKFRSEARFGAVVGSAGPAGPAPAGSGMWHGQGQGQGQTQAQGFSILKTVDKISLRGLGNAGLSNRAATVPPVWRGGAGSVSAAGTAGAAGIVGVGGIDGSPARFLPPLSATAGAEVGINITTLDLSYSSFSSGMPFPPFVRGIKTLVLDGCEAPGSVLQACIDNAVSVESVSLRNVAEADTRTLSTIPLEQLAGLKTLDFRGTDVSINSVLYDLVSALPLFGITVVWE